MGRRNRRIVGPARIQIVVIAVNPGFTQFLRLLLPKDAQAGANLQRHRCANFGDCLYDLLQLLVGWPLAGGYDAIRSRLALQRLASSSHQRFLVEQRVFRDRSCRDQGLRAVPAIFGT
ncbi:hypothetical protein D3C74_342100 [compost metagenome]